MNFCPEKDENNFINQIETQLNFQYQNTDDSVLNESRSGIEVIRQKRKHINFILKSLNQSRNKTFEGLFKDCVEVLKMCVMDILILVDEDRNNLAHICVKKENFDFLKAIVESYIYLVENKEDFYNWITAENSEGMSPIDIASQYSNTNPIKYLFDIIKNTNEKKLKLSEKRNNMFHSAAKSNECFPIIFFYEKLHPLYIKKNICIVNQTNQFGITPLHYACFFDSRKAIDILLDFGADINARDQDGATSLHYAIHRGSTRTIKKLLLRGADKSIKKLDGKTAYDLALENNQIEIAKILESKAFLKRYICMESQIEAFRPSRNDLFLIIIQILIIIFKFIYIIKIDDIVNTDPRYTNKKFNDLVYCLFDTKCIFETFITFSSLIVNISVLTIVLYFLCCDTSRRSTYLKKIKNSNNSLSEMYETNSNLCVICKDFIDINTVHCLICNICVDEWDHHCFWLNTCIHEKNKKCFKIFFYLIILFVILEAIFISFNFILSIKGSDDLFYMSFFGIPESKENLIYIVSLIWKIFFGICCLLMLYVLLFVTLPTVKTLCEKTNNIESNRISESRLISRSLQERESISFSF